MTLDGCLLVHKERGMTSFDVVARLTRMLSEQTGLKRRELPPMGHGGTLDPFATGLLVVCIGEGTKLSRYLLGSTKEYRGVMKFGESTAPGDCTEPANERTDVLPPSLEAIREAAASFCRGAYLQTPPMHSAKKVDGRPLYELARKGIEIERKAVPCRIEGFEIESYTPPLASYRVRVSAGTYIRVLAQDLARKLGSLAYLETLERTSSGRFRLHDARTLSQLAAEPASRWSELSCFVPLEKVLEDKPSVRLTDAEARLLVHGRTDFIASLKERLSKEFEAPVVVARVESGRMVAVFSHEARDGKAGGGSAGYALDRVFTSGV
jgi:tRNA pseudouridine55 synthase